jgi:hypothetical protein
LPFNVARKFFEYLWRPIAPIGELYNLSAPGSAGFHHLLGDLYVTMVKDRHQPGIYDGVQYLHSAKTSHRSILLFDSFPGARFPSQVL